MTPKRHTAAINLATTRIPYPLITTKCSNLQFEEFLISISMRLPLYCLSFIISAFKPAC